MPKVKRPENMTATEEAIVSGLESFRDDLKTGNAAGINALKKYTSRNVAVGEIRPQEYTPEKVKATRELLGMSQNVFAAFLGASTQTVSGWEQGKPISPLACRFMDEIQRSPEHFRKVFEKLAKEKMEKPRSPRRAASESRKTSTGKLKYAKTKPGLAVKQVKRKHGNEV